jgi:equilibrative nucleoside transporter 1/2/3
VAKGDKPTRFQAEFFTPVAFLIFSLGDWLGKALPGFPALPLPACLFGRQPDGRSRRWNYAVISGPWTVFTLTIARFLFIPLFLFSNTVVVVGSETLERSLPLWVNNDVLFYIIMAVFAVSNGWLGSLSMMHGPQLVRDYEREIAGTVMVFCLTIGLAAGSIFSFFLRSSMCHWCDPFSS